MARTAYIGLMAAHAAVALAPPDDQGAAPAGADPSPEEVTAQLLAAAQSVEAANAAKAEAEAKAAKLEKELEALKAGGKPAKKAKGESGDAFRVTVVAGTIHHPRAPRPHEDAAGVRGVPFATEGDDFTVTAAEVDDLKRPVELGMVSVEAI